MRLLILSDSHGAIFQLKRILLKEPDFDVVFHLGDGASDLLSMEELLYGKQKHLNKGNCDSSTHMFPQHNTIFLNNKKFFSCHGHLYAVKNSLTTLMYAAMEQNADICLYGHTHIPSIDFKNGILFVNPGAAFDGRYATIDLCENKQPYPALHILKNE